MKVVAILLMSLSLAIAMSVPPMSEEEEKRGIEVNAREVNAIVNDQKEREIDAAADANEQKQREIKEKMEREVPEINEQKEREVNSDEHKQEERGVETQTQTETEEVVHALNQRELAIKEASFNSTQCVYTPETRMFRCRGISHESIVECPAIFEWEGQQSFSLFGLGIADASRYWLYPRSLDNSTYLNHTLLTKGGDRDLFLYYGDKMVEYGFRVTDSSCFDRLISLIKVSSVEHVCSVEGDLSVPMVGEVLVINSEVTKRWGFGYGYGLGLGGWGYGGLGFGGLYGMGMYGLYGR